MQSVILHNIKNEVFFKVSLANVNKSYEFVHILFCRENVIETFRKEILNGKPHFLYNLNGKELFPEIRDNYQ